MATADRLGGTTGTLKRDVHEVLGSGQYHVTPEVGRQLRKLDRAADHIRLDQELLGSSRDWAHKFTQGSLRSQQDGAARALDAANASLFDVKNTLGARRVEGLRDNEVRESHQLAKQSLQRAEGTVGPFAGTSTDRIKQFCDHIGVTDRYTGYRHNLSRGSRDPVRLGYSWLDQQNKNAYNNTLNVGWKPSMATSQPAGTAQPRHVSAPAAMVALSHDVGSVKRPPPLSHQRCIQEQCGITMTFPGRTEYYDRYQRPRPLVQATPDYKVNPTPDFSIFGRPNARAEVLRHGTEYQSRYEWPDAAKIDIHPWIRV